MWTSFAVLVGILYVGDWLLDIYEDPNQDSSGFRIHYFTEQFVRDRANFYVYTRLNYIRPSEIWPGNDVSLKTSHYDPRKNTTVLIHGFESDSFSNGVQELKRKLLQHYDMNVIAVDYSSLMDHWWYSLCPPCGMFVVVLQAPKVGQYVATLIDFLKNAGHSPDSFHIVGHSLGAHIAGFAGKHLKRLNRTVTRITGLDPSSPGFTNVPIGLRLSPIDAVFTDCIFTTAKSISVRLPICKSNFYPNGCGLSQPGCFAGDFSTYGGCSHSRAVDLFAESIDPKVVFRTKRCDRMPCIGSSPSATCWSSNETLMGYPANHNIDGIFYTQTNGAPPFAKDFS